MLAPSKVFGEGKKARKKMSKTQNNLIERQCWALHWKEKQQMNRDTINELHKMTKMAVSLCLFSAEKVTAINQATVRALICLT